MLLIVLAAVLIEGGLWLRTLANLWSAESALVSLKSDLDLSGLANSEEEVLEIRDDLRSARGKLRSASSHLGWDPLFSVVGFIPGLSKQADGLRLVIQAGEQSTDVAFAASDVLLSYARQTDDPNRHAVQEAIAFLLSQQDAMADVRAGLEEMRARRAAVPDGLIWPLSGATANLDFAIDRLNGLITGYERAEALLPAVLGFEGSRRYLVLPQNDTELFPSGGLISNYGIAVFNDGGIDDMQFEYFVNLYDRWQETSGGEYIEPPQPLNEHLLRGTTWALGEAGWYPDFPTTAEIAADFVYKGGAVEVDGTIALDLQFVEGLLELFGPVEIAEYGLTVRADTLSEVTLEQTRDESASPGAKGKSFLSFLAQELLEELFASSKDEWVGVIKLLDRMAKERHFQLHFADTELQRIAAEYGFDGSLVDPGGDFLHVADTSVNSTKLNLILENRIELDVALRGDGSAGHQLRWYVHNPFPEWKQGRDADLVGLLMHKGQYGSYLRVYTPIGTLLRDVRLDGRPAGASQIGPEAGKMVFGRFFPVPPGESAQADFDYEIRGVLNSQAAGISSYSLYIQKQPGTRAIPLSLKLALPDGAKLRRVTLDGESVKLDDIETDLRVDRRIEVLFAMP